MSYEQNMETEKLMQNNDGTLTANQTMNTNCIEQKSCGLNGGIDIGSNGSCGGGVNGDINGGLTNGDMTKQNECIEMSTSITSVKCCNGLLKSKKGGKKIVKESTISQQQQQQQSNGVGNGVTPGKCYFNTLKAKLSSTNGKYQVNGDIECGGGIKKSKVERPQCVFDDRDPFKINSNVKFEFLNVFAEPNSGTYSFNPTWSFTSKLYFNVKLILYRLFAILIGIPCAFVCAIVFAIFSVFQIWLFMPILRMFKAIFGLIREIWSVIIDTVFGPIVQLFTQRNGNQSRSDRCSVQSQCPSSASSKSIYNEDVNVV